MTSLHLVVANAQMAVWYKRPGFVNCEMVGADEQAVSSPHEARSGAVSPSAPAPSASPVKEDAVHRSGQSSLYVTIQFCLLYLVTRPMAHYLKCNQEVDDMHLVACGPVMFFQSEQCTE